MFKHVTARFVKPLDGSSIKGNKRSPNALIPNTDISTLLSLSLSVRYPAYIQQINAIPIDDPFKDEDIYFARSYPSWSLS